MRIIGVTGGIGSGKSTVASILSRYGARVIDADLIARKVVCKGCKALDELVGFFGKEILDPEGNLNRKRLAELAFADKEKLKVLNGITHKYIVENIQDDLEKLKRDGTVELVVVDAPIPVEHGFLDIVDEVWVVVADTERRIERVMERSGLSREEAIKRINSQISDEEYRKIADHLIANNGTVAELEERVAGLLKAKKKGIQQ